MGKTAEYVLSLLEELLGPPDATEKRFPWCRGDVSSRTGRCVALPFDAVWEGRKLIIEIDEDQHRDVTPYFDKPDKLTVSGVHRGEQRRRYDERKRTAAAVNGYRLVRISWSRRQRQDRPADLAELRLRLL